MCTLSSQPRVSGLPDTVSCSSGVVSIPVNLPANSGAMTATYLFSLKATGSSTATSSTAVTVVGTASGHVDYVPAGTLTSNTTWSPQQAAAYVLNGYVLVPAGVTLTIEPGTVIKASGGPGSCNAPPTNLCVVGTLDAVGTASQPIIFTSMNDNSVGATTGSGSPAAGDWAGITIDQQGSVDLEHAYVEYDGYGSGAGLYLEDPDPVLQNDVVENVSGNDYLLASAGPFDQIADVTGSGTGTPVLFLDTTQIDTTTLPAEPIAWEISYAQVPSGQTLTIEPGTVIKASGGPGSCNAPPTNLCVVGTLDAVGTASQPIIFTSMNDNSVGATTGSGSPAAGDWAGITIDQQGSVDLEHAYVEYDGYGSGAGLYLEDPDPVLQNDVVENVSGNDYLLASAGPFDQIADVTGSGTGTPVLFLDTTQIDTTTLPAEPIAWEISYAQVPSGQTLTIEPGTVIKASGGPGSCNAPPTNLCVVGTLDAVGTASQPIIFTSMNDNSVGATTGSGSPAAGDWAGITIDQQGSVDLEHAYVEYDGYGSGAGLYLEDPDPVLQNDVVENVSGNDYLLASAGPFDQIADVTGSGTGTPVLFLDTTQIDTTTLPAEPIAWEISYAQVPSGQTLTIEPGTVIKASGGPGSCNAPPTNLCVVGTLDAVGTASQPIIFTSMNDNSVGATTGSGSPAAGDWAGITIDQQGSVDLEHAYVEYDGYGSGAGLYLEDPDPVLQNDVVENVSGNDYLLASAGPFDQIADVTGSGTGTPVLFLDTTQIDTTTLPAEPIAWEIESALVPNDQSLTIAPEAVVEAVGSSACNGYDLCVAGTATLGPGAVFKTAPGLNGIDVMNGGYLTVAGSASSPVVFTSTSDNTVGGITDNSTGTTVSQSDAVGTSLRYEDATSPGDNVSFAEFRLAANAISVGGLSTLNINNVDFWENKTAVNVDSLPWELSGLPCAPPFTASVSTSDSYWYPNGGPSLSIDPTNFLGLAISDPIFAGYYATTVAQLEQVGGWDPTIDLGSNTDSWAMYACPPLEPIPFPWFPVLIPVPGHAAFPNFAFLSRPTVTS